MLLTTKVNGKGFGHSGVRDTEKAVTPVLMVIAQAGLGVATSLIFFELACCCQFLGRRRRFFD